MSKQQVKGYRAIEDSEVQSAISLMAENPDAYIKEYHSMILSFAMYAPPEEQELLSWQRIRTISALLWALKDTPEGMRLPG